VTTHSNVGYRADVHISEVAMATALTVSIVGVSYVAFNSDTLATRAQTVADRATCRTLESAVVAYIAQHDAGPRTIHDLTPYVQGDISKYRLQDGLPAGPGCDQ
jgi:hypothetical protein